MNPFRKADKVANASDAVGGGVKDDGPKGNADDDDNEIATCNDRAMDGTAEATVAAVAGAAIAASGGDGSSGATNALEVEEATGGAGGRPLFSFTPW